MATWRDPRVDRFTRKSRLGRSRIPPALRQEVYNRDDFTCQYCGRRFAANKLTLDHLVPVSLGGLDEMTNYASACRPCNQRKSNLPLGDFAGTIHIPLEALPVHGDPVIDNQNLPIQIRLLRKRIYDRVRSGEIAAGGRSAQQRLEKAYRREFWQSLEGQKLEAELPRLPGHVRIMTPEILTIAKSTREYLILMELAKSANTRSLIGSVLTADCDVEERLNRLLSRSNDTALVRRVAQALRRFEKELRRRAVRDEQDA